MTSTTIDRRELQRDRDIRAILNGKATPARASKALRDIRVRDVILLHLTNGEIDADAFLELMEAAPNTAPGLTVAGVALWGKGDNLAAGICVVAALDLDPTYSLARLLGDAMATGMPYTDWQAAMSDLTIRDARHGRN